ncbi:type IV secretion system DNA-binding domain-containing protein [Actinokineospora sp. PR83]|uniref:type IV secretion system DNA-binding domain-containing protein n=1 Tax=Actinokineospora sp. PR83 TaxID=2884908 RepID=UPI001F1B6CDE|nr:type IV secretion system DNA-binding domain-containing protein [Actinokineospora sp. PR83]MCG8914913.1 type IV secretion system DNA-binding domain-containing protein [Actinokineospora sp. PR83]
MIVALCLVGSGFLLAGLVIAFRLMDAEAWRKSLRPYSISFPASLTAEQVATWLGRVAASTHASRFAVVPQPPIVLTVVATRAGIRHELRVPAALDDAVLAGLRAAMPGVRIEELPNSTTESFRPVVAAETRLTSSRRSLAVEQAEATAAHVLASLAPLGQDEEVRLEWTLTGAGTPAPVRADDLSSPVAQPEDSEALRAARLKQRDPALNGVLRLGVATKRRGDASRIFGRVFGALRGMNTPGVLLARRLVPSFVVADRMRRPTLPVLHWPVLAGTRELSGLLGVPIGELALPGLSRGAARQLPPGVTLPTTGNVVAESNYLGMANRPLALRRADRLRHAWVIGPTGVGKSTLLANMIIQDMADNRGLVVLDPKGDLVSDVLSRVPENRRDDVVLLDPSAIDRPVGLNILDLAGGEHARELAVDHLVHVMASLWRSSFGPRTTDVLRNALLTLTHSRAVDGSAHTLVELPEILVNKRYRAFVTGQSSVPLSVRPFWAAFEQMSDNERAQVIGPSLNKLRSFTTRSSLRLLLGQSEGIRLSDVFTKRRIVLVPLTAGVLGAETTALLGSLLMAGLWSAAQARVAVAPERRHAVFAYLDEFQNFLKLDLELADMLAAARGYGLGMVLSHQFVSQLTPEIKAAVLGTVRTQIAFSLELDDARALAPRFAPLTAEDLSGLAAYEIALRASVDNTTLATATGTTLPLAASTGDGEALARQARERYGVSREEVERALQARITPPQHARTFGREAST